MKRISIQELRPGIALNEPIYTRDRTLLLARGLPFTHDMHEALRESPWKFVFIGEWNEADAERYDEAIPLQTYRAEAERVADALLRTFQNDLAKVDLNAKPIGLALADTVDRKPKPPRTRKTREEFAATRRETAALIENICEGLLPAPKAAEAVGGIVEIIITQFCSDPSLAANLVNLKGAGDYLYTHSLNRAVLSIHIAAGMGYSRKQVTEIAVAALVADLGMAVLPRTLVNAPRRLSAQEFDDVQRHALYSLHAVQKMHGMPPAARFVAYQMHERYDGSGYPGRRKQPAIHRYAAIAAVADAYDALTSIRPWRAPLPPYTAMETVIKEASRGKYDRDAVRALLQYVSLFPVGSLVRLNTGAIGKVIHATGKLYDRPIVAVLFDRSGAPRGNGETVNLAENADLKIESYVDGAMGVSVDDGF